MQMKNNRNIVLPSIDTNISSKLVLPPLNENDVIIGSFTPKNKLNLIPIKNINDLLNKYSENLIYPLSFDNDILCIEGDDLVKECEKRLNNINKEIKEILIIKALLIKKEYEIDKELNDEIMMRIENELYFNKNEDINRIFDELEDINDKNYIKIGEKIGLDSDKCIYLIQI